LVEFAILVQGFGAQLSTQQLPLEAHLKEPSSLQPSVTHSVMGEQAKTAPLWSISVEQA